MAKAVAATTVGLLLIYELLIRFSTLPAGEGTSMQSVNIVRAEQFLQHLKNGHGTVLVGSSLIGNLQSEVWVGDVANLGQSGGNALTGLELILRQPNMPARVVVDVSSTIVNGVNESIFVPLQPLSYFGAKLLMCSQESYKPSNVFLSILKRRIGKSSQAPLMEEVRRANIKRLADSTATPLSEKLKNSYRSALANLRVKVDALQARGVRVLLVTIPTQSEIDQGIGNQSFVSLSHVVLPENLGYRWLKIPTRKYETSDGVHLVADDAAIVREAIIAAIE